VSADGVRRSERTAFSTAPEFAVTAGHLGSLELSVDAAIDEACVLAEHWYRSLEPFQTRVNLRTVVGDKHPAIVSEGDCVMHFARFLHECGIPWEAIHHQVAASKWLFGEPHPAASAETRWSVDLAVIEQDSFRTAKLPATSGDFQFDAFIEFKYLNGTWVEPNAVAWGEPKKGRTAVLTDVAKIGRYLDAGICRTGYVVIFESCDSGFEPGFAKNSETQNGCRVRFVRSYEP
jgi:hypothetical protein